MRTTIDLPDDLHAMIRELAHQQGKSMGAVVTELIRSVSGSNADGGASKRNGVPVVSVGRTVTAADVRSLDDE